MQAIVVHTPGGYNRLQIEEKNSPNINKTTDVLIKVSNIGVNYADCLVRLGLYKSAKDQKGYPIVPGFDFSGVVAAVGEQVSRFKVGDKVFGVTLFEAYQTEIVADQNYLQLVPPNISLAVAASLPTSFLTAYYILFNSVSTQKGERLLVRSVGGGVGSWLAILGNDAGAKVEGTVSTKEKKDALSEKDIRIVLKKEFEEGTDRYDVIANAEGGGSIRSDFKRLNPKGRLVLYGFHGMVKTSNKGSLTIFSWMHLFYQYIRTPKVHPFALVNQNKSVIGFNLSYLFDEVALYDTAMKKLIKLVESGVDLPLVSEIPFLKAADAHKMLESGKTIGKLVLTVAAAQPGATH